MGMAASQARLLSLTSRLHDVELSAQAIESQKISLATQKDELYQNYCDALDATAIKVAFYNSDLSKNYVNANYSTLCTYNADRCTDYALRDNETGKLIVSEEVAENYEQFGNDKYSFAWAMLGYSESFSWDEKGQGAFIGIGTAQSIYGFTSEGGFGYSLYMTDCEQAVFDEYKDSDTDLAQKYQDILDAESDSDKKQALSAFREYLYSNATYKEAILEQMNLDKTTSQDKATSTSNTTWDDISGKFEYYTRLWSAINEAGGCQVIDPQYIGGDNGNTWFNNMVEAGRITIMVCDKTKNKISWSDTSVATSTDANYLQEVSDDTNLKKAEAEYEHELDVINRKDTEFDTELSKLETERTSITTEIDAIQQVRDDNIDRTFGIFS